jgi:hypothetical protein
MPRRQATIERDIPLFLIPHSVLRGVRTHGEELERVIVRKTRSHFYNISIRTQPIKRELKRGSTLFTVHRKHKNAEKGVKGNDSGTTS